VVSRSLKVVGCRLSLVGTERCPLSVKWCRRVWLIVVLVELELVEAQGGGSDAPL
jgi:hypothetical protein